MCSLVEGLIALGGPDPSGQEHADLPGAGCSDLGDTPDELAGPGPDELAVCAFSVSGPPSLADKITRKLTSLP